MDDTVSFTRMDQGTYEDYQLLEGKFKVCYDHLPDNVLDALGRLGGAECLGIGGGGGTPGHRAILSKADRR